MSLLRSLGVIPARGGSKRVPRKNLRTFAGYPLIAHTIAAAHMSTLLTEWVVSTEDDEIEEVALRYGAPVLRRPPSLAQDDTTSGAVCKHALEAMEADGEPFDIVVLLHPTSPIRMSRHIDEAVALLAQSDASALASVSCRKRAYVHNASIYAMKRDWLLKTGKHYSDESIPYLMDALHSIDIDTELDLKMAEALLVSERENRRTKSHVRPAGQVAVARRNDQVEGTSNRRLD